MRAALTLGVCLLTLGACYGEAELETGSEDESEMLSSDLVVDVRGRLAVAVFDGVDGRSEREWSVFEARTGRQVPLELALAPELQADEEVVAVGRLEGGRLKEAKVALSSAGSSGSTKQALTTQLSSLGEQQVGVFLLNFRNDTRQPVTPDQMRSMVFGTIGAYFREASYGQTWLSGDVFGWITVDADSTSADVWSAIRQAIATAGIDRTRYGRRVYVVPALKTWYAGMSSPDDDYFTTGATKVEIEVIHADVITHELGHNLGAGHAGFLDCGQRSLGVCPAVEYGDSVDTMASGKGDGTQLGHFNAILKASLGWLGTAATPKVQDITQSGTYVLGPLETSSGTQPRALRIKKEQVAGQSRPISYWLEYRQPVGFDAFLGTGGQPVSVRLDPPNLNPRSMQLRVQPQREVVYGGSYFQSVDGTWLYDSKDRGLYPGQRYDDPDANLIIETLSADATQATVRVTFAKAPTLTFTAPAVERSGAAPGSTLTLAVAPVPGDAPLAAVEFRAGGSLLCRVSQAPWQCNWTLPAGAEANFALEAVAEDTRGVKSVPARAKVGTDLVAPSFTLAVRANVIYTYNGVTQLVGASVSDGATVALGTTVAVTFGQPTDNVGLDLYEVALAGNRVCRSTQGSCSFALPNTPADATWTFVATAIDSSGNATSKSFSLKSGNGGAASLVLPTATLTAPTTALTLTSWGMGAQFLASTSGAQQVANVGFFEGGQLVCSAWVDSATGNARCGSVFSQLVATLPPGAQVALTAQAFDRSKVAGAPTAAVTLSVGTPTPPQDLYAPTVSITSPPNGSRVAARSMVSITASASDNLGVQRVEFSVGGALLCTDTQAPYACAWTVPRGKNKTFVLSARAFDRAGNSASAQVAVYSR